MLAFQRFEEVPALALFLSNRFNECIGDDALIEIGCEMLSVDASHLLLGVEPNRDAA